MKQFTQLLTALVFCSLIIFVSCKKKKKDEGKDDSRDLVGQALQGTWTPTSAKFDGENRTSGWADFTITFSYNNDTDQGNYTVSGVPTDDGASDVWGTANGTVNWAFDGTDDEPDTEVIIREGDGIPMAVTLDNPNDPSSLILIFTVDDPDARTAGFYGEWEFVFEAQ